VFGQKSSIVAAIMVVATHGALAQPVEALRVCGDVPCGPISALTPAQKAQLQDPFFRLVLAREPNVTRLDRVQELIRGATGKSRIFVVEEEIKDPRRPQSRRAAIDFQGTNGTVALDRNVMLSIFFGDESMPVAPEIEVLSWDDVNGVYNYYKLEDKNRRWNIRASSRDADRLSPAQKKGSCLACHVSGVPIMKELLFPWNNWHSGQSDATYLTSAAPDSERWPVAKDLATLGKAEDFEGVIKNAIIQFNNRKFTRLVRSGGADLIVDDAHRVLRPLFETTEINFASATERSGMHPLPSPLTAQSAPPTPSIRIPSSFFLANGVLAGGRNLGNPLEINAAGQFNTIAVIGRDDYKALIERFGVRLGTRLGARPGDTHFAWFTPDMGFVAIHWIHKLVEGKVITPAFAAAAFAADLETPVFSEERGKLLEFVPPNFTADAAGAAHPDRLTTEVIKRLKEKPTLSPVAARFLAILESANPIDEVKKSVDDYKKRIETNLQTNGPAEQERLFRILIDRRQTAVKHKEFSDLIEFIALLPLPCNTRNAVGEFVLEC
jgi:hypothetical protein